MILQMQVITAVFSTCQVPAASHISFHLRSSSLRWMLLSAVCKGGHGLRAIKGTSGQERTAGVVETGRELSQRAP